MRSLLVALAGVALVASSLIGTASADGLIITRPTTRNTNPRLGPPPRQVPLQVNHHRVEVDIAGTLAQTAIDQVFHNPSTMQLEGTYLFPVPSGASISQFSMDVAGTQQAGEVQEIEKATEVYESIVRRVEDPALLEYVGSRLISMRIFPIEGKANKPVKITYNEELTNHRGLVRYRYPLNTEKFSAGPLKHVSIEVRIKESVPVSGIYSPTHPIQVSRIDARTAVVRFEARNVKPERDFVLYYQKADGELGLSAMAYQPKSGPGYFAAIISPHRLGDIRPQAKDVVFVVDTSHSMTDDGKMAQLRRALAHCVGRLQPGDRFNIVDFSSAARQFDDGLVRVSDASLKGASQYIAKMAPQGGTNFQDALEVLGEIAESAQAERPLMAILVTDGQPTIGARKAAELIKLLPQTAAPMRLFALGLGDDLDTSLLDGLAASCKGTAAYIETGDDLEEKVRSFFDKVALPALSNVKLTWNSDTVRIFDRQPSRLGDLFFGSQQVIFGRFSGEGTATVTLEGTRKGKTHRWDFAVDFRAAAGDNSYLAHLHAKRKIGGLLDRIRREGESDALKNEVVYLARKHGILTPYTAYLVLENEQMWRDRFAGERGPQTINPRSKPTRPHQTAQHVFGSAFNFSRLQSAGKQMKTSQGEQAVQASRDIASIRDQAQLGVDHRDEKTDLVRRAGDKAFYKSGAQWVDSAYTEALAGKLQRVKYLSKGYFALLRAHAGIGKYLALGKQVIVVVDEDTVIEVVAG